MDLLNPLEIKGTSGFPNMLEDENLLLEHESGFQFMADFCPQLMWMAKADGWIYWYNRPWYEYTGASHSELEGRGWQSVHEPEALPQALTQWQASIQVGEPFEMTFPLKGIDGRFQIFLTRVVPLKDKNGQVLRWLGTSTNIHALKSVQQEYEGLFTYAREGIFIADDAGRYLNVNAAGCKKLGLPKDEIIGRSIADIFFPGQAETFQPVWEGFLAEGSLDGEISYTAPDGRQVEFEFASVANYIPDKHLSVLRDITARKKAQNALQASEERFRAMADSAPLFIWMSGANGSVTYVNKTWTEFLGLSREECVAYGMRECMLPEEQKKTSEAYWAAFSKQESYTIECRMRRSDGMLRWILSKGVPMFLPDGSLTGYMGTSIDITDRKEAEERLATSLAREQLIRRVMEAISQSSEIDKLLLSIAEELGRYLDADRSCVNRYCIDNGELSFDLSAQYCREDCKPVDMADINAIYKAFQKLNPETFINEQEQIVNISGQASLIEYMRAKMAAMFPEGLPGFSIEQLIESVRKYDVQSSMRVNIFYHGAPYGSISVSQCTYNRQWTQEEVELVKIIAEHAGSAIYQAELYRQAQETAEKEQLARKDMEIYARNLEISNRELEQFATIASHDLKEPLRKIQVFGEMVQETVPEESKEYLIRMRNAANRMQTLIEDLLVLSRVSRKGKPFGLVNLNHCIQGVLDDLQVAVDESDAEVAVSELETVYGDEGQIRQLVQNLIGNSIKYRSEDVVPVIRIYGERIPNSEDYQITVEDNGIGIDERYSKRIFEPFQRLHELGKYPGTGMGLAICKKIVERHRGTITVESVLGQGSKFTFTLPSC